MFKRIRKALRRHPLGNERGQSTVEYILMLSVVVIVAMKFKTLLMPQIDNVTRSTFQRIEEGASDRSLN